MMENTTTNDSSDFKVPEPGQWPGAFAAYRLVKPVVKPQIWNLLSAIGLGVVFILIVEIIWGIIFKHQILGTVLNEITSIIGAAFIEGAVITIYFAALKKREVSLSDAIHQGLERLLSMVGLLIVMYIIIVVSLLLLIVPFFFILPRVYIAPYFLISENATIGQALSMSWNKTKGNVGKVYGIFGVNILIALLVITIVGIPFALYFGTINTASYALLTMYLLDQQAEAKDAKPPVEAAPAA